jgi:hypothetical protein
MPVSSVSLPRRCARGPIRRVAVSCACERVRHIAQCPGPRGSVLLLCKHAGFGGTGRVVQHLARGLPLAWFRRNGVDAEANPAVRGRLRWGDLRWLGELVRGRCAEVANLHFAWSGIPLKDVLAVRLFGRARCVPGRNGPR